MSERWRRRKARKRRFPWFNLLNGFDRLEKMMDEMMNQAFNTFSGREESPGPYVYGFSMYLGSDGKPMTLEFGNVRKSYRGHKIRERMEPLVDVIEEDDEVVVVVELPGAERDDINLHTAYDELVISVHATNRMFHKRLKLPARVNANSAQASYKNGVLEVRLKRIHEEDGKEIFVE